MSDPRKPKESFSARYVSHIATLDPPIGPAPRVLLRIYDYHTREAESCWPGRERLAKLLLCNVKTVSRANTELEKAGYISRSRRMGSSSLTYLEQINASPDLQEFARHILSGEAAEDYNWENKRSSYEKLYDVVKKTVHSSSKKLYVETSLRETHLNNNLSTPSASTCSSGNTYHEKQIVSITDKFLGRGDKDCQAAFTVLAAFLVGI